ncbi:MAG TPA: hypothetical protein VMR18_00475 [Candidatus Saccharimonadales bacterium]|nr:hypothetical protein [Candidatus Saccharimonadales bacterium]
MTTLTLEREGSIFSGLEPERVIEEHERILDQFAAEIGGARPMELAEGTIHQLVCNALTT